jgi:hypothetical protein
MLRVPCLARGVLLILAAWWPLRGDTPLLYLPFDGSLQPALQSAQAASTASESGPGLPFVPGRRGQAVTIGADCRLPSAGNLSREAGTVAFWIRPHWEGGEGRGRTLFCVYGKRDIPESWMRNRWSLTTQGGRLTGVLYGSTEPTPIAVSADIGSWRPETWHHVAFSWQGINSGKPDGQLCLFVDGVQAQRRDGFQLAVGEISDLLDVGRDSDASPDYAEADLDEFYLYGRALALDEIVRAIALADQPEAPATAPPAATSACGPDWWNGAWRFRCAVQARLPATATAPYAAVRLPIDLNADLARLGLSSVPDLASLRLVPVDAATGTALPGALPLPARLDGDALVYALPESARPGAVFAGWLYAGVSELDTSTPLFARARQSAWSALPEAPAAATADYATTAYGDAWDFDEGDLEGIDQWGNKPEFVRNRAVKDGVLSMDVSTDPWFIWGDMWGQVQKSQRPVAIDLARYPVLRLRVRQSCPEASWDLYARLGTSPDLLHHEFRVTGTGWQTLRIDLVKEAGWAGTLSALRLDPTSEVAEAHVEIDWVQATNEIVATRGALECLGPAGIPAPQRLGLAADQPAVTAGTRQTVTARALDAQGQGIAGWPLTVSLTSASDGRLSAAATGPSLEVTPTVRRAVTGPDGSATVALVAGRRAGQASERLTVTAAIATATASMSLDAVPGPPHHCRVTPDLPLLVRAAELPLAVTVQIEDEAGNALPVPGRTLSFRLPKGVSVEPLQPVTDAQGAAQVRVTLDPAQCWVWRLEVEDNEGLRGTSAPLTYLPDGPRPDPIHVLPNGYFADSAGHPFVPLGGFYANWVQSATPDGEWGRLQSFTDTTDAQKRDWMRFLADNGITAMRFMLRTHRNEGMEPMDIGGRVNPGLFAEAVRYLDLGREFNLRFQLVVHEDYTKPVYVNRSAVDRYALPNYSAAQLAALPPFQRRFLVDRTALVPAGLRYTDPDAMACQDQYARELAQALLGNPQVLSYELENEMVNCPAAWVNHAIETIHSVDPGVLVGMSHGGGGLHTGDPLYWHRNATLGYYNYHLYPAGTTTPELDYGALVDVLTRYGRMAGTCFMGESAGDEFGIHPDREVRRWVMRDIIWMALANGNPGVFFWNARGAEVREFRLAREAMGLLDLATFRRLRPEIAIDVTHPLDNDQYYRTPQGGKDLAMMGRYANHYLSLGVDADFTVNPAAYAKTCTLTEFAPPEPTARPFQTGPGWQLKFLAREDWREVLVYVRNLAAVEPWEVREPRRAWKMFLRTRQPMPLNLGLALPAGQPYAARVYDLDGETARTLTAAPTTTLDLGTTDHDWVLVLKRP